jgi:hypothetical protein
VSATTTAPHTLYIELDDGEFFEVAVTHWPEDADPKHPEQVFLDYWPPRGWTVIPKPPGTSARAFSVDMESVDSLVRFESDFGLYVSERLKDTVAIHAAVIQIGEALILVPGVSRAGKSTLALAAHTAGYAVWSDEYCLVNTIDKQVTGWNRPLRERLEKGAIRRVPIPAHSTPGRLTHVVAVKYDPAATEPLILNPLSPADVAMELLANTVCAQSRPVESLSVAAALANSTQGFTGTRAEAQEAWAALVQKIGITAPLE